MANNITGETISQQASTVIDGSELILVEKLVGDIAKNFGISVNEIRLFIEKEFKDKKVFVNDQAYVHTDENFTTALKQKLEALQPGGGGGGTTDYTQLANKPAIGGVTLEGNKTPEQMGLQPQMNSETVLATLNGQTVHYGDRVDLPGAGGGSGVVVEAELNPESTNAIQNGTVAKKLSELDNTRGVFNISELYPTGGASGDNIYTLSTAINKLTEEQRYKGVEIVFFDGALIRTYQYNGGQYTQAISWNEIGNNRFEKLQDYDNTFNISKLYPTGGTDGTDVYSLGNAIQKIPNYARQKGVEIVFFDGKDIKKYQYNGENYGYATSWIEIGDSRFQTIENNINNQNDYFNLKGYIDKKGDFISYAHYRATEFIKINNLNNLVWEGMINLGLNDISTPIAFYDKNFIWLQSFDKDKLGLQGRYKGKIEINSEDFPIGTYYIRCTSSSTEKMSVVCGHIGEEKGKSYVENSEILNYSFFNNFYLRAIDGTLPPSQEHYYTGFQEVDHNRNIILSVVVNYSDQSTPLSFYDENYMFISSFDKKSLQLSGNKLCYIEIDKKNIPPTAKYYRVGSYKGNIKDWYYKNKRYADTIDSITVKSYPTIRECLRNKDRNLALVGSQFVKYNRKDFFEPKNFVTDANRIAESYNYMGLTTKLPQKKLKGYEQKYTVNGEDVNIIAISKKFVYLLSRAKNVYRAEYVNDIDIITAEESSAKMIALDVSGEAITNIIELNDGNILIETKSSEEIPGTLKRKIYKAVLNVGLDSITSVVSFKFQCADNAQIWSDWDIDMYDNIIVTAPYGQKKTAQVWVSEDYGDTFKCIFNAANDTTFVSTKPKSDGGLGAVGKYPLYNQIIPEQRSDFWDVPSEANGNIHIHCVRYDNVFKRIYISMGDYYSKSKPVGYSAIYYTDDLGVNWHYDYFNAQCLTMIPMQNVLLAGTDGNGHGIFRYSRGEKELIPQFELAYQEDEAQDVLDAVGNATAVDGDLGFILMCPNTDGSKPKYTPYGNIICTDGFNFKKIYIDQFADGTNQNCKIRWHATMIADKGNIIIKYRDGKGILRLDDIY